MTSKFLWGRRISRDRDNIDLGLYEDAKLVLAQYGRDEKFALGYIADLMKIGAVSQTQANQLLKDYCGNNNEK